VGWGVGWVANRGDKWGTVVNKTANDPSSRLTSQHSSQHIPSKPPFPAAAVRTSYDGASR
jgi:hypothetical protein